jgi:hypothetical protein
MIGLTLGLLMTIVQALGQVIQSEEQALAALNGPDAHARASAVAFVHEKVPPLLRSPALESALVKELASLNELRLVRRELDRAGQLPVTDFPAEYYAQVIQVVAESSSPAAIESLAGALGTGTLAENGLAKFGDAAVPILAKMARAKVGVATTGGPGDTPPEIVASAIATMQKVLQTSKTVSSNSRAIAVTIARERLAGNQFAQVVVAACGLAVATGDGAVVERVAQLARAPEEIQRMGVTEAYWVQRVQRAALAASSGR